MVPRSPVNRGSTVQVMKMRPLKKEKEETHVTINNCIELSGRWVPGMSRGRHYDQAAP